MQHSTAVGHLFWSHSQQANQYFCYLQIKSSGIHTYTLNLFYLMKHLDLKRRYEATDGGLLQAPRGRRASGTVPIRPPGT